VAPRDDGERRGRTVTVVVAALALGVVLGAHLLNFGAWGGRYGLLDAADEWSLSHILATLAFAAGAVICTLYAVAAAGPRREWAFSAVIFALLLADNLTRLHEHLAAWPALYAPLLGALCITLLRATASRPAAIVVRAGIALLAASLVVHVLGHEVVERVMGWGPEAWGYQIKVGLKEGTELAGWALLVPGLARAGGRLRRMQGGCLQSSHPTNRS
jgi:hypothetical protein